MKIIIFIENLLVGISMVLLVAIPAFSQVVGIDVGAKGVLYTLSFGVVFLAMVIRPLADIFSWHVWLRQLVLLRKGFGVLSASIIVGLILATVMDSGFGYLQSFFTADYYSLKRFVLLAHIGDITGIILLVTSNGFSQRLLRQYWKPVQRLAYVYFYAGGLYEVLALGSAFALYAVLVVTNLVVIAWAIKAIHRNTEALLVSGEQASV